jgi:iron(III) transport system permease protein
VPLGDPAGPSAGVRVSLTAGAGIVACRDELDLRPTHGSDDTTLSADGTPVEAVRVRLANPVRSVAGGLLALAAFAVLVVAFPAGVTMVQAFQGGWSAASNVFGAPGFPTLVYHTLEVAAVATPLCGVFGLSGAWLVERTDLPGRQLWALLLVAPLTMPLFVTSYAWATLAPALDASFYGAAGIIAFTYYPIVFLLVAVALRGLDPALEETAASLGLRPRQIFFRVVLPQLRPALLGGLLLVALDALVELDAFVALKFQTFSTDIYDQYRLGFSTSGAAALSYVSILFCVAVLFGEARLRGNANYTRVSLGARRLPVRYGLGRLAVPSMASMLGIVAVGLGIPVAMLIKWFSQSSQTALSGASGNLRYLWPATVTTVELGLGAAVVAIALAAPVALLAVRRQGWYVTLVERGSYLSYALPDLVGGIAIAYAASHWAHFAYGSFTLLVLAEAALFVPFAVVALRATLGQIEPVLEESARALGAGPLAALWRVTAPLARPGYVAAAVLVFAFTLGDLGTTQVLLPLDKYTLGTEFQANSSAVAFTAAAPFAAVLVGLAMVSAYVVMSRFGTVRRSGRA